jgi:hypothetical protein
MSKRCQKVVKKLLKSCQKVVKMLSKNCQKLPKSCRIVVKKLSKSCHKKLSPSELKPKTRKTGKLEKRKKKEETTKNGRKNEEWLMKKLGIRRLDATSSHLVTNWDSYTSVKAKNNFPKKYAKKIGFGAF